MNKKIKHMMIFLTIILIILVSLLIFSKNRKSTSSEITLEYIKGEEWNNEIYPDGMPKLFRNYSGELKAQNIGKSMYYVTTKVIPKYYTALKTTEISDYYNQHSKDIAIDIGIENEQDFKEFMAVVQHLNTAELTLNSFRIDKDKINKKSNYTNAILYITYEGNDEIGFHVKIYNSIKENTSSLIYTALK